MNREDIIRMAREANIKQAIETPHLLMVHELERFAALVAAEIGIETHRRGYESGLRDGAIAEREACAVVAERHAIDREDEYVCDKIATAIRARGKT